MRHFHEVFCDLSARFARISAKTEEIIADFFENIEKTSLNCEKKLREFEEKCTFSLLLQESRYNSLLSREKQQLLRRNSQLRENLCEILQNLEEKLSFHGKKLENCDFSGLQAAKQASFSSKTRTLVFLQEFERDFLQQVAKTRGKSSNLPRKPQQNREKTAEKREKAAQIAGFSRKTGDFLQEIAGSPPKSGKKLLKLSDFLQETQEKPRQTAEISEFLAEELLKDQENSHERISIAKDEGNWDPDLESPHSLCENRRELEEIEEIRKALRVLQGFGLFAEVFKGIIAVF